MLKSGLYSIIMHTAMCSGESDLVLTQQVEVALSKLDCQHKTVPQGKLSVL